jgi:hypothetical protein
LALLIGMTAIGWTQWAFTNKYLGWFVLLCYGATGAMATRFSFSKVLWTFINVGCAICAMEAARAALMNLGFIQDSELFGLSNNRNAFAFQCIMVLAASLAHQRRSIPAIALALIGIWLSASRAGICTAAIVLVVSAITIDQSWRKILPATLLASTAAIALFLLPNIGSMESWSSLSAAATADDWRSLPDPVIALFVGRTSSTAEHFKSMIEGFEMFLANPFFGAGLGKFIASWSGPNPLIIHSTLIWLLAEFGIIGALLFTYPVVRIFVIEVKRFRNNDTAGILLILIITGFSAMSVFHEVMYQRTLWLLLGMGLAHVAPAIIESNRQRAALRVEATQVQ